MKVRNTISTAVKRNKEVASSKTVFSEMMSAHLAGESSETNKRMQDHLENIMDIRYTTLLSPLVLVKKPFEMEMIAKRKRNVDTKFKVCIIAIC